MISSVFPGEIPGRSRLALLGRRGFPLPGSVTGKADRGLVTKVNLFYNGKLEFLSDLITRYSHAGVDDDELSANFYETTGGRARIVMDGLAEFLKDSATVPGAPEGLTAAGNGQTRMDLSWNAPRSDGGTAITGYRVEVSENGSTWVDFAANTRNADTSYSHTGLTAGSTRNYRVSAINSAGTGPASNIATGGTDTSSGNQAPDLVGGDPRRSAAEGLGSGALRRFRAGAHHSEEPQGQAG